MKPAATYLTARTIDALARVGALDPEMTTVVTRADGIIANQPADGRFSIEELLQLEAPGFIATLYPGERGELPAVWSLLETTNAAPKALSFPPAPTTVAVDGSKGTLARPSGLPRDRNAR